MLLSLFPSLESECCGFHSRPDVPEEILEQVRYWEACFMRWHDDDGHRHDPSPKQPLQWFSPVVAPPVPDPAMLIPPGLFGEWFSLQGLVLQPIFLRGVSECGWLKYMNKSRIVNFCMLNSNGFAINFP